MLTSLLTSLGPKPSNLLSLAQTAQPAPAFHRQPKPAQLASLGPTRTRASRARRRSRDPHRPALCTARTPTPFFTGVTDRWSPPVSLIYLLQTLPSILSTPRSAPRHGLNPHRDRAPQPPRLRPRRPPHPTPPRLDHASAQTLAPTRAEPCDCRRVSPPCAPGQAVDPRHLCPG
jgi:hypothetical protein